MRWYLDEQISPRVAEVLRDKHEVDVKSCLEVGMAGETDAAQLEYATQHDRLLVSYNKKDFILLANQWYRMSKSFRGIGLFDRNTIPQDQLTAQVRTLLKTDGSTEFPPSTVTFLKPE